jgi:cytochrome c5
MSSFSKNIIISLCVMFYTANFSSISFAAVEINKKTSLNLVDGYYPEYPMTTAKSPQKETLIKRGEYLSKMGDCISCHTNVKKRTPAYSGGLPIATPFGTFYSPNITPDKETGIGNWTKEDFIRALKEGKNPKGQNYFPVFPFVYFANVTKKDAEALYEYFMSIPPVHQENTPLPFPFNVPGARSTLLGWDLLFFYPNQTKLHDKNKSHAYNRGRYIVDGLGHCSMCHTPLNPLGATKKRYYLTGTFIDGYWAPNITKLGLESANHDDVANIFVSNELLHNAGPVSGPMAEVNHNSLKYLTSDDRLAISTYLKSVESDEPLGLKADMSKPSLSRGRQVYLSSCAICHQDGKMSAPIIGDGPNWTKRLQNNGLAQLYKNVIYGYNSMPIKGACVTCSNNDIISAVDYILDESLSRAEKLSLKNSKK